MNFFDKAKSKYREYEEKNLKEREERNKFLKRQARVESERAKYTKKIKEARGNNALFGGSSGGSSFWTTGGSQSKSSVNPFLGGGGGDTMGGVNSVLGLGGSRRPNMPRKKRRNTGGRIVIYR